MTPARQLARDVLMAVEERGGYASDLLHSSLGRGLRPDDLRLATEIVMGVLRFRAQLDYVIERAAARPAARIAPAALVALRIGVYQLRFLDRIPASAAVNESVAMAKAAAPRLAGFVNAVLRHASREPVAALLAAESSLGRRREVEFSHPAWLLERWSRAFGPEAAARIAEYDNQVPPVAIRVDAMTMDAAGDAPGDAAASAPPDLGPGLRLEPGRLLAAAWRVTAGDVTKTAAYREGRVWVQDEASQLVAYLLEPDPVRTPPERLLDACAAPGGKAAILHALAPRSPLVALEPRPQRARLLRRRLHGPGLHVVAADAVRPLPFRVSFDRILVDAPCTGTGTLARNPEIRWRLAAADPARLAILQTALLANAAAALRPGGRLVYSVCSLEPEEGPGVVNALLGADSSLSLVPATTVLASLRAAGHLRPDVPSLLAGQFLQILPGAAASDGFFAAVLERAR